MLKLVKKCYENEKLFCPAFEILDYPA